MLRADSSPENASQPDQQIYANASGNLEGSPYLYSQQSGSPLYFKEKSEAMTPMQNSNLDFTLGPNNTVEFGPNVHYPKSDYDFDLDREPRWAFEGEALSAFSDKPKPIKVLVITWNLNGKKPGEIVEQLLNTRNTSHHIVAIATQECLKSIGMSFLDNSKDEWVKLLKNSLGNRFSLVKEHTMNAIHLAVFARKEVSTFIRDVESAEVATGFANFLGNKGAVGISFKVLGNSFLFLSCHLACGQSETERRNQDFERIIENLPLPWHRLEQEYTSENEKSIFSHFDFVFCAGDLNYRIDLDPQETVAQFEAKKYEFLLEKDQLNLGKIANKNIFGKFYEGEVRFGPTYKFQLTSQELDETKEKRPAWTDRILYAFNEKEVKVAQKSYDSNRQVFGSDHRPVFSQFLVGLDLSSKKKLNAGKEPLVKTSVFCGL